MREIRLTIITATLAAALLQFLAQHQADQAKAGLACLPGKLTAHG
jgi:hypothetical protein